MSSAIIWKSPRNLIASAERHQSVIAQVDLRRNRAGPLNQCHGIMVAWQSVKVSAMEAGKRFDAIQSTSLLKRLEV